MAPADNSEKTQNCVTRIPKVIGSLEPAHPALLRAAKRASWIISHSEAAAERLIEEADLCGRKIREQHAEEGHRHGRMDAIYGITAIQSLYSNIITNLVSDISQVVEIVSREIIAENLELASEVLSKKVIIAVSKLRKGSTASVRVNPADLHQLEQITTEVHPASVSLTIVADSSLARGSFIVETPLGAIDGSLEQHLVALTSALRLPGGALEDYARAFMCTLSELP